MTAHCKACVVRILRSRSLLQGGWAGFPIWPDIAAQRSLKKGSRRLPLHPFRFTACTSPKPRGGSTLSSNTGTRVLSVTQPVVLHLVQSSPAGDTLAAVAKLTTTHLAFRNAVSICSCQFSPAARLSVPPNGKALIFKCFQRVGQTRFSSSRLS